MPSPVSWTGISSSTVTRWIAVRVERSRVITASAWRLDRPDLGQPGQLVVDVEELGDPAGGRGVQHDRVVLAGALVAAVAVGRLVDLAGQQHVAHARGDRGGELDRRRTGRAPCRPGRGGSTCRGTPAAPTRRRWPARRRRRTAGRAGPGDQALLVGQRRDVEELRDALAALDLAQQHGLAARRPSASARAAATVVLPVPPLPVTMCSCTPGQSGECAPRRRRSGSGHADERSRGRPATRGDLGHTGRGRIADGGVCVGQGCGKCGRGGRGHP